MTITGIEDNLVCSSATAINISSRISLLDAIHFVARSWRRVKAETITNCFCCGIKPLTDSTVVDKPSMMENEPALSGVTNGENYLNIDDLACFQECEELDDDIVEEIVSKRVCIDQGF